MLQAFVRTTVISLSRVRGPIERTHSGSTTLNEPIFLECAGHYQDA